MPGVSYTATDTTLYRENTTVSSVENENKANLVSDTDPYSFDDAALKFINSKPTCFIVIGKPGSGKTELAKKLALEWKCQLINVTELIQQHIDQHTDEGQRLAELLVSGSIITEEMALQLIKDKMESPEVAHHGYVLDGFPCLDESCMPIREQMQLVEQFKLKPDFIINLAIPDNDLRLRLIGQRIDPESPDGTMYIKQFYDPDPEPFKEAPTKKPKTGDDEEEEEEEEELEVEDEEGLGGAFGGSADFPLLPPEIIQRLIRRPEDMPECVERIISCYREGLLRLLEDYMANHDLRFVVELNANLPPVELFKQLMVKLGTYQVRPAVPVSRLFPAASMSAGGGAGEEEAVEEEAAPEDIAETEELMRILGPKNMIAPKFRWQRSRWLRYCPVELYEGNLVPGKTEFAVGFLNKVYVLSSNEALTKFSKNPRPYLLPPQPRPPCKVAVLGAKSTGKTSLCRLLELRYQATIIDMDQCAQKRIAIEKVKQEEIMKAEALQLALISVRKRIGDERRAAKDAEAAEKAAAEEAEQNEEEAAGEVTETPQPTEEGEGGETAPEETPAEPLTPAPEDAEVPAPPPPVETAPPKPEEEGEEVDVDVEDIDENHPEVFEVAEKALAETERPEIQLSPETYMEILEEAVMEVEKKMRHDNPNGKLHGSWVLDNFPKTRDQWSAMMEKGIEKSLMPDEVIMLRDSSESGDFLSRRWYNSNREAIDAQIKDRLEAEERERQRKLEEERRRLEEEQRVREEEERLEKERRDAERQARIDAGEEVTESAAEPVSDGAQESDKVFKEEGEASTEVQPEVVEPVVSPPIDTPAPDEEAKVEEVLEDEDPYPMPPSGPEFTAFLKAKKDFDSDWNHIASMITGNTAVEPQEIIITDRAIEDIVTEVVTNMEKPFKLQAWELTQADIEEDDEDNEAAAGEEELGEEEMEEEAEEEDPARGKKKWLGDTNHYDPVCLYTDDVMWPGAPEIAAKYRGKLYYFATEENREKFIENPTDFLPTNKPPRIPARRILILGAKGSGKTMHGRHLAQKHDLFHISFKDRLQEIIMPKTKKKVGPEYEEEEPIEDLPPEVIEKPEAEKKDDEEENAEGDDGGADKPEEVAPAAPTAEGEVVEEEEEVEVELTEHEAAIRETLETGEPLPTETLDWIFMDLWKKEPYRSTGFILEGFPRTAEEVKYLAEQGLFPDLTLLLNTEEGDIVARLLPAKVDKWKERRKKKNDRKQELKDRAKRKKQRLMDRRRKELLKELEEKRKERQAEKQAAKEAKEEDDEEEAEEEEEEEEEEEMNIDEMLAEEFEEEEEEEDEEEETEEEAVERITNEIAEIFEADTSAMAGVLEALEEVSMAKLEIEAGKKATVIRYQLNKSLRNMFEFRDSVFDRVYPIKEKLADKLFRAGYLQASRFGRWCPVKLIEGDCMMPLIKDGPGAGPTASPALPAIYRGHIYFLSSKAAREQFVQNPTKFLRQPGPKPAVPVRLAIIGPPKSGKTTLARRFCNELGVVRVSVGEAIRKILTTQWRTELAKSIRSFLIIGQSVPKDLAAQAVKTVLMDTQCTTRGYILDGCLELLTDYGVVPFRVIELTLDNKEVMLRGAVDRNSPEKTLVLHDSDQILAVRLAAYHQAVAPVRRFYKEELGNLVTLSGAMGKWRLWEESQDVVRRQIKQIQTYMDRRGCGQAASIFDMCIRPAEFISRLGEFEQYCPVSLQRHNELVDCSLNPSLAFAAEFRGKYYKMNGKRELEEFLKNPQAYVLPEAKIALPPEFERPKRRDSTFLSFPTQLEIQGFCPVTFVEGKCRYESLVVGDRDIIAELKGKMYAFQNEDAREKFMRFSNRYCDLQLPSKLPPMKDLKDPKSLPLPGYLEQTLADALRNALTAAGNFKPKFPFLSSSRSACIYVAYHLKAFNPKSPDYIRQKYKQKLLDMEEKCDLIRYLGDHMAIKFKEPNHRPIGFDSKMKQFMALKHFEDEPQSWVQ